MVPLVTLPACLWATALFKFVITLQTVKASTTLKQNILSGLDILDLITRG